MLSIDKVKRVVHVFMLTRRYFGYRAALNYLARLPKAIRSDALVLAFEGGSFVSNLDNIQIRWFAPNPQFMEEIIEKKCYLPNPFFEIGRNDTVLDLGANIGTFAIYAALKAVDGLVIAVEPNPHLFELLKQNVMANGLKNLLLLNGLVGGQDGTAEFYMIESGGSVKMGYSGTSRRVELPQYSISTLIERYNLRNIDFLKMDIEGAEFDIFGRDAQFLGRVKRISMEVHPDWGETRDILQLLASAGFLIDERPALLDDKLVYIYARRP